MPVQINEVLIRATINEGETAGATAAPASATIEKEELIRECTERILAILDDKKER